MFYTKYRPQKFSEISKPNDTAFALMNQLKSEKTVHAYLFIGPRGTGKTTTARILAKSLNCKNLTKDGDPCGKCEFCEPGAIDLIEIDAASNRGIDDIRELRERVGLMPARGEFKTYIIDEVHMLTSEAFNALLKTLEEPPKHVVFILCTTEGAKVPETIKSRCQVFKFKRATVSQIVERLKEISKKEKIKIEEGALRKIAESASGGFRDAETLLQQVSEGGLDVESFVGSTVRKNHIKFVGILLSRDCKKAIEFVNKVFDDGTDLYTWTAELVKYLRDLMFVVSGVREGLLDVTQEEFSQMEDQAGKLNSADIVILVEAFNKALNDIKGSFITQLPVEIAIVTYCGETENEQNNPESFGSGGSSSLQRGEKLSNEKYSSAKYPNGKNINFDEIVERWQEVVKVAVQYNHSVQALLKATRPVGVKDGRVILEVFYAFHKERLESPKNREIVEKVLEDIFENSIGIVCVLGDIKPKTSSKVETGELTDYNVIATNTSPADIDIFDGNLPA